MNKETQDYIDKTLEEIKDWGSKASINPPAWLIQIAVDKEVERRTRRLWEQIEKWEKSE